jgi:hypothetical protein
MRKMKLSSNKKIIVAILLICTVAFCFILSNRLSNDDESGSDILELVESKSSIPKKGGRNVLNWTPPSGTAKELQEEWNRAVKKARLDIANFDLGGPALRYMLKRTRTEMETLYRLLFGSGASRNEF